MAHKDIDMWPWLGASDSRASEKKKKGARSGFIFSEFSNFGKDRAKKIGRRLQNGLTSKKHGNGR